MTVAALLARAWYRDRRAAWIFTAAALALSLALLMLVLALLAGLQHEADERARLFAGDARASPGTGLAPAGTFNVTDAPPGALAHIESQLVISRRGFLTAAMEEDDQFDFRGDGDDAIAIGLLLGLPPGDQRWHPYRIDGALPAAGHDSASAPLVMPTDLLRRFLTAEERATMAWPPRMADVAHLRFDLTTGRVSDDGIGIEHRTGRITGLYETDLNLIDGTTVLTSRAAAARLNDWPSNAANVLTAAGPDAAARLAGPATATWHHATPHDVAARHLGAYIGLVEAIAGLAVVLLALPATILLSSGLRRHLAESRHATAVAHAIGLPHRTLLTAQALLVTTLLLVALTGATAIAAAIAATGEGVLIGAAGIEGVPASLRLVPGHVGLAMVAAAIAGATALLSTHRDRIRIATALRAP